MRTHGSRENMSKCLDGGGVKICLIGTIFPGFGSAKRRLDLPERTDISGAGSCVESSVRRRYEAGNAVSVSLGK